MLDIHFIRDNKQIVLDAIKNKHGEEVDLDRVVALYEERKEILTKLNDINQKRNLAAQERNIDAGRALKEEGQALEEKTREILKEFISLMSKLPNIPSIDTPIGKDESENVVLREWGEPTKFSFTPKPHWELGEALGVIDSERAGKVSGARFTYLKGDLALLQFALIQFTLETLTNKETLERIREEAGVEVAVLPFTPVVPPVMIKPELLHAMGRLEPKEDKFYIESDNLYLVGSAEHSIGSMFAEETLKEEQLPLRYVGYSTAFRREAGSYGKDTRGILRMHQFDKLEMETFVLPGDSFKEQDFLVAIQEYLVRAIEVPYRVMAICTGDMGTPDQRQMDIEMWMPGQDTYRETHSADLIGAFQPRRLNTRVKRTDGGTEFVHMNDATAFAIGRTIIAIMENHQQEDGTIRVPKALVPYMGGREVLGRVSA